MVNSINDIQIAMSGNKLSINALQGLWSHWVNKNLAHLWCANFLAQIEVVGLWQKHHGLLRVGYRTWENFGGRKFWRIITDEANGEEKFSESAGRSSVISLYL